jgi:hypothetical protein
MFVGYKEFFICCQLAQTWDILIDEVELEWKNTSLHRFSKKSALP